MTEFTIMGNYKGKEERFHEFYIEEGRNEYTVHVTKTSTLLNDLDTIAVGTRIKVNGIVMQDAENRNILVCNKATVVLGNDSTR